MNKNHKPMLPSPEKGALLRECYAIDALPDSAVGDWMDEQHLDLGLHARLGSVMGLAASTPVPKWAQHQGTPWPQAGMRLIAPLCDAHGAMRSFVAQHVTGDGKGVAVPAGYSTDALLVACPTARGALAGTVKPKFTVVTDTFASWMRWVETSHGFSGPAAVWGMLPNSWAPALLTKIPENCTVVLVREANTQESDRLLQVRNALKTRVANGDIELKQWPPVLRSA